MTVSEQTRRLRRQGWYGAKKHVKIALSLPPLHGLMRAFAPRVLGLSVRRLPAPSGLREVRGRAAGAEFTMLRPDRCEVAKELYWGGGTRPDPRDSFALELVTRLAQDARLLLDIGAYTGVFSLAAAAANPRLRVLAFDIVPPVVRMLEANVVRNGLQGRVQVRGTGVGDPDATMRMPAADRGPALPSFYSQEMDFDNGVDVGFVSLDSLTGEAAEVTGAAEAHSGPVPADASSSAKGAIGATGTAGEPAGGEAAGDKAAGGIVMKIDVEGGETDVFGYGQEFLTRFAPDILCEVLPGARAETLERQLAPHGMRFYAVGESWLEARDRIEPQAEFRDWLLTPRTPDELRGRGIEVR
ncbi:FkbM family methyltransferase [Brevibacterium album]|uniref:FkbM family methyltransferase n=1 Tax=Brevibacterium album TaxID=417948 RepID=UPI0004136962|nr:FkbM family methyltransferase [Brevibacterium album]